MKDLFHLLENIHEIPLLKSQEEQLDEINQKFSHCLNIGGILVLQGDQWSGKNQLVQKALDNNSFSPRVEFSVQCSNIQDQKFDSYLSFFNSIIKTENAKDVLESYLSPKKIFQKKTISFVELFRNRNKLENEHPIFARKIFAKELSLFLKKVLKLTNEKIIFWIEGLECLRERVREEFFEIIYSIQRELTNSGFEFAFICMLDGKQKSFPNRDFDTFQMNPLSKEDLEELFFGKLAFSQSKASVQLFEKLYELYSSDGHIPYLYFTQSLKSLGKDSFQKTDRGYLFVGNINHLTIPQEITRQYLYEFSLLDKELKKIIEAGVAIGFRVHVATLTKILSKTPLEILYELRSLEETNLIRRKGNYYEFANKIVYLSIFQTLHDAKVRKGSHPIFMEYNNKLTEITKTIWENNKDLKLSRQLSDYSYFSSDEYDPISIEVNLFLTEQYIATGEFSQALFFMERVIFKVGETMLTQPDKRKPILKLLAIILNNWQSKFKNSYKSIIEYCNLIKEQLPKEMLDVDSYLYLAEIAYTLGFIIRNEATVWTIEDVTKFSDHVLDMKTDDFQKGKALFWKANSLKVMCSLNIEKYLEENQSETITEEEKQQKIEEKMQSECKKIFDPLYRAETYIRDSAYVETKEKELFLSKVLYTIGEILVQLKDFENASRSYKDSYNICKKYNDIKKMTAIKKSKIEVSFLKNQLDEAERHAIDCLELNKEINNEYGVFISNYYLWKIYLKQGNQQECLRFYKEAINSTDFKSYFIQNFVIPTIKEEEKINPEFVVPEEIRTELK